MIEHVQGMLSKSAGTVTGAGSAAKALAAAHPVGLGIIVGLGAYFVVSKYWLDNGSAVEDAPKQIETAA